MILFFSPSFLTQRWISLKQSHSILYIVLLMFNFIHFQGKNLSLSAYLHRRSPLPFQVTTAAPTLSLFFFLFNLFWILFCLLIFRVSFSSLVLCSCSDVFSFLFYFKTRWIFFIIIIFNSSVLLKLIRLISYFVYFFRSLLNCYCIVQFG